MTKLVSVRLVGPTGDQVTTDDFQQAVRRVLEPLSVGVVEGREGDARIHWSALGVTRMVDRAQGATAPPGPRKKPHPDALA